MTDAPRDARTLLVEMLHEAAQLEHCLLDAYLYTACSLKSMPQELATIGGEENRRRALHFERIRGWKQTLLTVAQEEMLHLHYVQCLLRALGEPPSFALPERDESGSWIIPAWKARIGQEPVDEGRGVEVPVEPLSARQIRRFVLFESTDALQDADPFGPAATDLFERLYAFETDLRFESMLLGVADDARRAALKQRLAELYGALTPVPQRVLRAALARTEPEAPELPPVEDLHFQSIADFYEQGILPLYRQAFDFGWVTHDNLDLNDELQDPQYAQQGFLPVGPVYRDKNFEAVAQENVEDPLRHYKDVGDIVSEIVDEGEGMSGFEAGAEALLAKVAELGGSRAYLQAQLADRSSPAPTPPWLAEAELVRQSHLYRFAMVMTELDRERQLAAEAGVEFTPAREPLPPDAAPSLADELPAQFNAVYLVLLMWLSRMYEIRAWSADLQRRKTIEALASWPLMSIAIRPFLELASFLPVDVKRLFRVERDQLPMLPVHAQQLLQLYGAAERDEDLNRRMDYLAVRTLSDVARWAAGQRDQLAAATLDDANAREMMMTRLGELARLDEFEKQFPFRLHGGYSSTPPDLSFRDPGVDPTQFEEDPARTEYVDAVLLRLRFGGRGQVQMATDPDPSADEAGCTGTHMLHAADGDRRFDRALVWQDSDPAHTIVRGPRGELPDVAVNCADVALVYAGTGFSAGYLPLQVMQSVGAVQTSGLQQVLGITGLSELVMLTPGDLVGGDGPLRLQLLPKDGRWPYQVGYNHLVWQDGEPIDPFVLAILDDEGVLLQREIFNEGRSILEMSPLQRVQSMRWPAGFDSSSNIPDWVLPLLPEPERRMLKRPKYPMAYLSQRAAVLADALQHDLDGAGDEPDRAAVDEIVSYAERMKLVSVPRGTTVGWLGALLHYGHSVSGELTDPGRSGRLLGALGDRLGVALQVAAPVADRTLPNSRWLVRYAQGAMDTDALSDIVYGDLYIPLTVSPSPGPATPSWRWTFPIGMRSALEAYAVRFDAPFWARFDVSGDTRTVKLPDGTTITETLVEQSADGYRYTMTGVEGINDYEAAFTLTEQGDRVTLAWSVSFRAADAKTLMGMLGVLAPSADTIRRKLAQHFAPVVPGAAPGAPPTT